MNDREFREHIALLLERKRKDAELKRKDAELKRKPPTSEKPSKARKTRSA